MLHSGLDTVPRRQARRSLSHASVEMGARLESTRNDAMPFTDKRGAALQEHFRLSQSTSRVDGSEMFCIVQDHTVLTLGFRCNLSKNSM